MIFQWSLTRNLVNSTLLAKLRAVQSPWIMKGMCEVAVQVTKRAFYEQALRPSTWAPKRDGTEATLMKRQVLRRSPRVILATATDGRIGSDRKYAAIHQLGGRVSRTSVLGRQYSYVMPARPYFPFRANGQPTLYVKGKMERVAERRLNAA